MSTSIIEVRAATNKEWDELWRESANSTYFHSREWAEIWSSYTNGRVQPTPRLVLFSDGAEALLPLSPKLTDGNVGDVVDAVSKVVGNI